MIKAILNFLLRLSATIRLTLALPILILAWSIGANKVGQVIMKASIYPYETIEAALEGRRLNK